MGCIRFFIFGIMFFAALPCAQQLQWFTDMNGKSIGHTTCNFLTLPVSASQMATGTSAYSGSMDATDLPFFQANGALSDRYRFAFTHNEWLMGMRKEYLGALFPVLDVGTFGGYLQIFTPGAIENARDIDEQPTSPFYLEYTLGATYARGFLQNRLSAGVSLSFVESHIENLAGRTMSTGFDLRYAPFSFISGHLRATNIGGRISYSRTTAEPIPAQLALSLQSNPLPSSLPLRSWLGITLSAGVLKTTDEPVTAGVSSRFALRNYGAVTAGYEYVKGVPPSINGLSVGAEVKTSGFTLSGSWRPLSETFGPVWAVTLLHEREELKPLTAEDYYQIAVKHYRKHRVFLCTRNAKKALRLDPNMWKAHALLAKLQSDQLREKRREIAIVYTGNARGVFTNQGGTDDLGGFAREATVISTLRSQFPLTLTIEAGNMVTGQPVAEHGEFAGFYLDYIGYDAVAAGEGELQFGIPKIYKETKNHIHFIVSNIAEPEPGIIRHATVEREGYRFFIASYSSPGELPPERRGEFLPFDYAAIAKQADNADIRILVVHDSWENIRKNAAAYEPFNFIICGSLDQRFPSPMRMGNTYVCSAGSNGRYVGNLTLRFDEKHALSGVENRLIPLQNDIVPDSIVARRMAAFSRIGQDRSLPPGVLRATDGAFVFMSDRDGKPGIYCKVTDQKAEFPLTRDIADTCDYPVWSFAADVIACRAKAGRCRRLMTMRFDGSDKRYVADSLQVRDMSFTPDGEWLYYAAARCGDTLTDIYKVKSSGGPSFPVVTWSGSVETAPAFSPTDSAMVFGSDRDGTMQLYLTNIAADLPLRITDSAAAYIAASFSPDGKYVAYLSDVTNFGGRCDLWVFERKSGTHRRITQRSNVKEYCWLSDSRTIVFTMGAMHFELVAVDITNFRYHKLVEDSTRQWEERSPRTIMFEGKEHILYTRSIPDEKEMHLYRVSPDGSDNTRVVNSAGKDWLFMREE